MTRKVVILVVGVLLIGASPLLALSRSADREIEHSAKSKAKGVSRGAHAFVEGEVLVKFKQSKVDLKKSKGLRKLRNFADAKRLNEKNNIDALNLSLMRSNEKSTEQLINELKNDINIEYVEPNFIYRATSITNDPEFANQWGLHNTGQLVNGISGVADADIDFPEALDYLTGKATSQIKVGIIDSGVDLNNPELSAHITGGYDFVDNDSTPQDLNGHGTHVAGVIAALGDNGQGITGFSNKIKLVPYRVLDENGLGTTIDIVLAVYRAYDDGVHIVNMSLGSPTYSQSMYDAMSFGGSLYNTLFVVASGNGGDDGVGDNNDIMPSYPANYDLSNIISVAASDQSDSLTSFSNYGPTSVDVAAPGKNVVSTYPGFVQLYSQNFEGIIPPNLPSGYINPYSIGWFSVLSANGTNKYIQPNSGYYVDDFSVVRSDVISVPNTTDILLRFNLMADIAYCSNSLFSEDFLAVYVTNTTGSNDFYVDFLSGYYDGGQVTLNLSPALKQIGTSDFRLEFSWLTQDSACSRVFRNSPQIPLIDDVTVERIDSNGSYEYLDGTSMAAPFVAGLAALMKSYNQTLSFSYLKNIIIQNVDPLPSLNGKTVSGGRINAYKSLLHSDIAIPVSTLSASPGTPNGSNSFYTSVPSITLSASDDTNGSGVNKTFYNWNGGSYVEYTSPIAAPQGTHTLNYYSSDNAGNNETAKTAVYKVDSNKPSVNAALSIGTPDGSNGWYKTVPTITLSASDGSDGSGVDVIRYRWDGGGNVVYAGILGASEGVHTLSFSVVDKAGNSSDEASIVIKIDATDLVLTLNDASYQQTVNKAAVTVRGTVTDNGSGIANVTVNGVSVAADSSGNFSAKVDLKQGNNVITVIATDNAGRSVSASRTIIYKKGQVLGDSVVRPIIRKVSPNSTAGVKIASANQKVKVIGSNFKKGAKVKVGKLTIKTLKYRNKTFIEVTIPLSKLKKGKHDVTVTNPDGQTMTLKKGFTKR